MTEVARAHCPVCCGDLEAAVVYCARCSTPHHDECWRFTGMCAIYGCASQQFTGAAGEAPAEGPLVVDGDSPDVVPPRPAPVSLPARRTSTHAAVSHGRGGAHGSHGASDGAVELAQGKRAAFRRWVRELLDEGLRVPRLWSGAPVTQRRMTLPEVELEVSTRREGRILVALLWLILPVILILILLGELTRWTAFELGFYLVLTLALQVGFDDAVQRELTVDSAQNLKLITRGRFRTRRGTLANLRQVAAVAMLVQHDPARGLVPGVVLLDFYRRPTQIPGLVLPPQRGGVPEEEDVDHARAIARFVGVSFTGAVDAAGRRRRLLPAQGREAGA